MSVPFGKPDDWEDITGAELIKPAEPVKPLTEAPNTTPSILDEIVWDEVPAVSADEPYYAGLGIVRYSKTGLEWIAGPDRHTTWNEAKAWVESLNVAGGGWSMPTMAELKTLYQKGAGTRNMTPLLKTTGWWVWSGETKGSAAAWGFDFYGGNGNKDWGYRNSSSNGRAFAVRSQKFGIANPTDNFLPVHLPKGVRVELPRNWTVLSNNQRITLDSYVQAKREVAGVSDPPSELGFAANYYDDQGTITALFNIRYYPEMTATQEESHSITVAETKTLDEALKGQIVTIEKTFGMRVLKWMGTTKQSINGIVAFVSEYCRAGIPEGTPPFRVRLVKVPNASRSFTITVSYREDQEVLLRAICDRIIQSIQTKAK